MDAFDEQAPDARLMEDGGFSFKGTKLAPYAIGRKLFAVQFSKGTTKLWTLAVLYILTLPEKEARAAIENEDEGKERFYKWLDAFAEPDYSEASKIVREVLDRVEKARIDTISEVPAGAEKKT